MARIDTAINRCIHVMINRRACLHGSIEFSFVQLIQQSIHQDDRATITVNDRPQIIMMNIIYKYLVSSNSSPMVNFSI
jgi:hypothetical protein